MWHLLIRDWLDLLGDRKYLMITIGVPLILMPLIMLGMAAIGSMKAEEESERVYQYHLSGEASLPRLEALLNRSGRFEQKEVKNELSPKRLLAEEELDLVLEVTGSGGEGYQLTVHHKETSLSGAMMDALRQQVDTLAGDLRQRYFEEIGISSDQSRKFLNPINLKENLLREEKEVLGQFLGVMVNFLVVIWMLSTALAVAADIVTGEKERYTLETLLISPLSRTSIMVSKWLTLASACAITITMILSVYYISLLVLQAAMPNDFINAIVNNLGLVDLLALWVLLIPQCLIVGGILLLTSISAKTLKDAQSSGSVVMIILMVPMLLHSMEAIEWNLTTQWIPLANLTLANAEILKGTFEVAAIPAIVLSNGAILAVIYLLANRQFRSERVLFG